MDERSEPRVSRFEEAYITCDGENYTRGCVLTNLSSRGARRKLADAHRLPDEFNLAIPQNGVQSRVRVVWRRPGGCGVKFLSG